MNWRRARQWEVTPEMTEAAARAVDSDRSMGDLVEYGDFAVLIESHYDNQRGAHRGASVMLPGDLPVPPKPETVPERGRLAELGWVALAGVVSWGAVELVRALLRRRR